MKTLAVCPLLPSGTPIWSQEPLRRYPGADWLYFLAKEGSRRGINIIGGFEAEAVVALDFHLKSGNIDRDQTWVLQEREDDRANALYEIGAKPWMLTNFESPLFAPEFYDRAESISERFTHFVSFEGLRERSRAKQFHSLAFPSWGEDEMRPIHPWRDRNPYAFVVSNKHHAAMASADMRASPSWQWAADASLHDLRYQLIAYFYVKGLELRGQGWEGLRDTWAPAKNARPCRDKLEVLAHSRFTFVLENTRYVGNLTEKVIDAYLAGSVPIYLGDPRARDYLPRGSFIDADGKSFAEIHALCQALTEQDALTMIDIGRRWLLSDGKRHLSNHFAAWVLDLFDAST